jgi:hypothetical protein
MLQCYSLLVHATVLHGYNAAVLWHARAHYNAMLHYGINSVCYYLLQVRIRVC